MCADFLIKQTVEDGFSFLDLAGNSVETLPTAAYFELGCVSQKVVNKGMWRGYFLLSAALTGFKGSLPEDNNKARIVTPCLPEKPSHDKEAKTDI